MPLMTGDLACRAFRVSRKIRLCSRMWSMLRRIAARKPDSRSGEMIGGFLVMRGSTKFCGRKKLRTLETRKVQGRANLLQKHKIGQVLLLAVDQLPHVELPLDLPLRRRCHHGLSNKGDPVVRRLRLLSRRGRQRALVALELVLRKFEISKVSTGNFPCVGMRGPTLATFGHVYE